MNRAARRARASRARKKRHHPDVRDRVRHTVVAVHEAGHAVARVLTADDMGVKPEEAIDDIEMRDEYAGMLDGQKLTGLAICRGPMFSTEIEKHHPVTATSVLEDLGEHCMQKMAKAKAAGVDVRKWLRTRALIDVMGPAAQAKFLGAPILEVWESSSAADDRDSLLDSGRLAGLDEEAIHTVVDEAINTAREMIERPEVWRAVLAVSERLPAFGKIEGKDIAHIVLRALAPT